MAKLRIGVLMGGISVEREVSFNSGRTVCDHIDTSRYEIVPLLQTKDGKLYQIPWYFLHRGKTTDFEHRLAQEAVALTWDDLKKIIDFAFIAMHGRYAEDGLLQGLLEVLGIPYLGSGVLASALCMDKITQRVFLQQAGIQTPRSVALYEVDQLSKSADFSAYLIDRMHEHQLGFPCVVKPHAEGSSIGVRVVYEAESLGQAVCAAAVSSKERYQPVIIEEKLVGMEFAMIVLTNYKTGELVPLPPTEVVLEDQTDIFDYNQKYMPGRAHKFTPARADAAVIERIQRTVMATVSALGITTLARVDGFVTDDNRIVIVDPNTFSGLAPSSFFFRQAAELGMTHAQVINYLIETELYAYGMLSDDEDSRQIAKTHDNSGAPGVPKIRVVVLMGGDSNEREISLESGRNVTYKLSPALYEVVPIFVSPLMELFYITQSQLVLNSTAEIINSLKPEAQIQWANLPSIADFVFIALHGGRGENGSVQGMLEMLRLPYNGSGVLTSALCMDKYKTNQFLKAHGFEVPQGILISLTQWEKSPQIVVEQIVGILKFPIIVKPHDDGCSILVQQALDKPGLMRAVENIFKTGKMSILAEEFLASMELTVGVLGNTVLQILPPTKVVRLEAVLSMEEKFLPGAGENITPAPLSALATIDVQETVRRAYQALGCKGYARIDCFYQSAAESPTGHDRVIVLEVNTLPGLTPATCIFHQAAEVGMRPMDFLKVIIDFGLYEHRNFYEDSLVLIKDTQLSEKHSEVGNHYGFMYDQTV